MFLEELKTKQDPYLLSLVYRLHDMYDLERLLLEETPHSSPYLDARRAWHELPLFEQMVPRPPLRLPYSDPLPQPETLEQLCIVTEGDGRYFEFMIELIESIRQTEYYRDVPVYILDGGLTDEQKQYFFTKLKVKDIQSVDACNEVPHDHVVNRLVAARPFMDRLFPGHRYYVYMDADTWIHDERAMHKMIRQAEQQGISLWKNEGTRVGEYKLWFDDDKILDTAQIQEIADKPLLSANLFCIDTQRHWFSTWKKLILDVFGKGRIQYGCDEATICYMAHKGGITEFLTARDQHFLWFFIPFVREDPHVLYGTDFETPIGIMHITGGMCGFNGLYEKPHFYLPTQKITHVPSFDEKQNHWGCSQKVLNQVRNQKKVPMDIYLREGQFPNQTTMSFHFRVWPWEDKNEIRRALRNYGLS